MHLLSPLEREVLSKCVNALPSRQSLELNVIIIVFCSTLFRWHHMRHFSTARHPRELAKNERQVCCAGMPSFLRSEALATALRTSASRAGVVSFCHCQHAVQDQRGQGRKAICHPGRPSTTLPSLSIVHLQLKQPNATTLRTISTISCAISQTHWDTSTRPAHQTKVQFFPTCETHGLDSKLKRYHDRTIDHDTHIDQCSLSMAPPAE